MTGRAFFLTTLLTGFLAGREASAEGPVIHATAGLAHALGARQASERGLGGTAGLALEIPIFRALGLQAEAATVVLSDGDPPTDPSIADPGTAVGVLGALGARLRFARSDRPGGLWVDGNLGAVMTGSRVRPAFDAHLGYDFAVGARRSWAAGPFVEYLQILHEDNRPRPEDARVAAVGLHVAFGGASAAPVAPALAARRDRDRDALFDDEDACPDVPGVRTVDAATNGCPRRDRDGDSVFDDEDACPTDSGMRSTNPKTNGCPPQDRDRDGVIDSEDACPDIEGMATADPKTRGCPRSDRDHDGIFDDEDACPDLPGPTTADSKTTGCPPAQGPVSVSGDRIKLEERIRFETGSERVRHASWPLVKKLAKFFDTTPDILEVDIEGHADEVGDEEFNIDLSRRRAESVKRLLVGFGVEGSRLTTNAYGESRPRVSGHSEQQRRENRRVEFTIMRARAGNAAPPSGPLPNGGIP